MRDFRDRTLFDCSARLACESSASFVLYELQEVTEHLCVQRRRDSRVYTSLARHLQLVRWLFSVRSLAHTNHFIFILQKSYRYSLGSLFRSSWV